MNEIIPTIVLIEDEKQIRRFLRTALEAASICVIEAATGTHGLVEIVTRKPDMVILDLGLPDMDGVDLIGQVRSWNNFPILILSARSEEEQKVRALDAGADDYLTKPFGSSELMARIRAHLRRGERGTQRNQEPVVQFGNVSVDFMHRWVTRNGEAVHLTPTEYRLLSVLVANAGKVLTHARLLREVWGPGHVERSHYLRIYMGHLRLKLENNPARPEHIFTETGVGYRLVIG